MRRITSLALLSLLAQGLQAALPPIPLFTALRPEMYKYAYPEKKAVIEIKGDAKARQAIFTLPGEAWSGGGLGVDKQRAADYLANGALELYVRGSKGGEKVDVGFVMQKGLKPEELAFQVILPLNNYVKITTQWQKVQIPLKDFPKDGSRWIESEQRRATGPFNWNRVSEFVLSRAPGGEQPTVVSFANVLIVDAYDAAKVQAMKPAVEPPKSPVTFFGEGYAAEGGGAYAYPEGKSSIVESGSAHDGRRCLKITLANDAWAGGGIYHDPMDLRGFVAKGVLEIWVKGSKGGEEAYFGVVSKTNGASVRLSSGSYLPNGMTTSWQKMQIPLKDFPKQGTKWDEANQKQLTFDFDWAQVTEILFDNNGAGHSPNPIFVDDVAIKDKP